MLPQKHLPLYSPEQIRAAEAPLVAQLGEKLMRRAAFAVSIRAARMLKSICGQVSGSRVLVLAGTGNNGGDALYAAAELEKRGVVIEVWQLGERIHPALGAIKHPRLVCGISNPDLIIDGILGIGSRGALRGVAAEAAERARAHPVLAVDIPSGIDPMTGESLGASISARCTVTFGGLKPAHILGWEHCGQVVLEPLGIDQYLPRPWGYSAGMEAWPMPGPSDHKYTLGVVGIHAGSEQYPGAAVLCTTAAARASSSMVRYVGPCTSHVLQAQPEVVAGATLAGKVDAWVTGPGTGTSDPMLAEILRDNVPVVIDADALTQIAGNPQLQKLLQQRDSLTVLTPHDGEFQRLCGRSPKGRVSDAQAMAREFNAVVVLKGRVTVIASSDEVYLVEAGSSWAATPGSGDVLAGIIAKGVAFEASIRMVASAVRLHCLAAASLGGPAPAGDIAAALTRVLTTIDNHGIADHHH
ncbi:NAD(P)H-hydrate epimerase [Corynebacterium sp. H127]|uniref:NAD(P)H-hydrate epimerase n=1 Tax=Corynebacterium sp. H127 TaxID=3133418 RepID=UPI003099942E